MPNLDILSLPRNNLGEMEGWQALATFLSYAPNLSILTLYSNNLTSDSAPSLIDFFLLLQRDCMLTVLLDDDEINEQTADSILAALEGRVQNIQLSN